MKISRSLFIGALVAIFTLATGSAFAGEFATTTVTPANQTGEVGSSFTVDIIFQDDPGIHVVEGIEAWINFDPTILQASSVTTGAGSPFTNVVTNTIDNTNGLINYKATGNSVDGFTITAATIVFTAIAPGTSPVGFNNVDEVIVGYGPYGVNGNATGGTIEVTACTPSEQTFTILGANGSIGDIDPYSQSLPAGATEWQPVYLTGGHPWGLIPGTNSWVNFDPDNTVGLDTRTPYRIRFEVPADYTNPSMVFQLKADNRALIWINNTFIDSVDGSGNIAPPDAVVEQALHVGVNEIRLMMVDWGGIVGFNYRIDVTMTSCEDITDAVLTPDEAADLNNAPTADAGPDQNSATASVTLDGSGSSDQDGNLLTYSWSDGNGTEIATGVNPILNLADGSYTFTLTVSDGELTDTDDVVVVVQTNNPPVVEAGADQAFDCVVSEVAVTLDGSGSSDPDGDALSYSWSYNGSEVSTNASFTTTLGAGNHVFTLSVSDGQESASDAVTVTVVLDETAPELTVPEDGTFIANVTGGFSGDIGTATATDACDAEPAVINDAPTVFPLGATEVTWTATDVAGNSVSATQQVTVVPYPVLVDIKPESDRNRVNPRNRGVIPVAILSTDGFDATTVEFSSILFGPGEASPAHNPRGGDDHGDDDDDHGDNDDDHGDHDDDDHGDNDDDHGDHDDDDHHIEDVDEDGDLDLILHFRTQDVGIDENTTELCLTGTANGVPIAGCDEVDIRSRGRGFHKETEDESNEVNIPLTTSLSQNYPNPFNPNTAITYGLSEPGVVTMTVFDLRGSQVQQLIHKYQNAGIYQVNFDASTLATGTYIYVLEVNGKRYMEKMTLMK